MAEELLSPAPHNSAGSQQLAHTGENENHALYGELVHGLYLPPAPPLAAFARAGGRQQTGICWTINSFRSLLQSPQLPTLT